MQLLYNYYMYVRVYVYNMFLLHIKRFTWYVIKCNVCSECM